MKKTISLLSVALLVLSMLVLCSCSHEVAKVESVLEIDADFVGHRSITVKYPLSADVDELKDVLIKNNPTADSDTIKFEYEGVTTDGYSFVTDIHFSSRDDYVSQIKSLVGRDVSVFVSCPDTVFASGVRMTEDFDVSEIIGWIVNASEDNDSTRDIGFDYSVNTVSINGQIFNTASTVDVDNRSGKPINSITIDTTNLKDGTYDRVITFSIPNSTYDELAGSIKVYFDKVTTDDAQYAGWTSKGTAWQYQVIYKSVDIETMVLNTSLLLGCDYQTAFYGDKNNSATPLSEGLTYEESFDTFAYMSSDGDSVQLEYKYALPTKTTHSDGTLLADGKWTAKGKWEEGVYTVQPDTGYMSIRIPDGIQYAINGIRFELDIMGENNFVRTTEFLYSKTQGYDGMNYAKGFFTKKGAQVECDEDDENLICRVVCTGTAYDITDQMTSYFGSGNFMAYTADDGVFSVKTKLTDYVNLCNMLNSNNANRPMTYTVCSHSDENIKSLECDDIDATYTDDTKTALVANVQGGIGTVMYRGSIPNTANIIICVVLCALVIVGAIAVVVALYIKRKKTASQDADDSAVTKSDAEDSSDTTTEFDTDDAQSADDAKLRLEIDKDVNEKIEAQRLCDQSEELKSKEIAELERLVYDNSPIDGDTADTKQEIDNEE